MRAKPSKGQVQAHGSPASKAKHGKAAADAPQLSEAEWKVMRALWRLEPATARMLLAELDTEWAYTTLKTMLTRLVEKGTVAEDKSETTTVYRALVRERDARGTALKGLLERAFDGGFGALVHHMLQHERLSARDRAELARLVAEAGEKERDR